jgi:replicative DNA helicase
MAYPLESERSNIVSGRTPPQDLAAEEALLGAMLLSREAIAEAYEICSASDFYKPTHAAIFSAIITLYNRGEPADAVTVADELKRQGAFDKIGDHSILISLQADTPAITNAARYAKIIEELATLRRMIKSANEIAELGYSLPDDVDQTLDKAEALIFDIAQHRSRDSLKNIYELLSQSLDQLQMLSDRGDAVVGVPTGFVDLDKCLAGLQKSNLVIVGARPGMGKTAFALGIALNAAVHDGVPVLYFSLEMSHMEITQRLLAADALVDVSAIRTGRLSDADWARIGKSLGRLGEAPIFIDDDPSSTIMDIRAKARRLSAKENIGLVIVDYLQLMTGRQNAENRQVQVAEISRGLKILARELEIPVVALSQLSRNLDQRADKRPVLSDLRESGSLEQDADVVLFIYREESKDDSGPGKGSAEVIVAKHRNGPTDKIRLVFREKFARFDNAVKL